MADLVSDTLLYSDPVKVVARLKITALLDSMWNWQGYTPEPIRYFRINPDNHSGRRLYRICGDHQLLVTNSCSEVGSHANVHGKIDPGWVANNLNFLKSEGMDLLLVCGKVAYRAYHLSPFRFDLDRVIFMDHPAARRWSNAMLNEMRQRIDAISPKRTALP